jgi:hypothetical protein
VQLAGISPHEINVDALKGVVGRQFGLSNLEDLNLTGLMAVGISGFDDQESVRDVWFQREGHSFRFTKICHSEERRSEEVSRLLVVQIHPDGESSNLQG